jgi:hypothetical protein
MELTAWAVLETVEKVRRYCGCITSGGGATELYVMFNHDMTQPLSEVPMAYRRLPEQRIAPINHLTIRIIRYSMIRIGVANDYETDP